MLDGVGQLYPFKHIFVSESLEAYKLNPKFFQHVIRHCNLQPREILHIGDSKSDIIAPVQLEIKTCWLNRGHQPWLHPSKPDFEVHSLLEVLDLLGLATSTATP
jgi:FMN phosphatase YigB (HAD superfamily)